MKDILLTEIVAMDNLSTYGYDTIISQNVFQACGQCLNYNHCTINFYCCSLLC